MAQRTLIEDGSGAMGDIPPIALEDGKISNTTAAYLSSALRGIISKFNTGLSFGSGSSGHKAGNFDAQYIDVYTPAADTEFLVPHGLNRKPIGYEVVRRDKACVVYDSSGGSWSDSLIYLKCNVINCTIKLRVY